MYYNKLSGKEIPDNLKMFIIIINIYPENLFQIIGKLYNIPEKNSYKSGLNIKINSNKENSLPENSLLPITPLYTSYDTLMWECLLYFEIFYLNNFLLVVSLDSNITLFIMQNFSSFFQFH